VIVFDVETSGLDEKTNGVIGLGAIMLPGGDTFYHEPRLTETLQAHPKALEVNGFTEEEIRSKDRIDMETTLRHFNDWAVLADDMILGGWNSTFDYRFLAAEYERHGLRWPFKYRVVDIQSIAYTVMRLKDKWTPMHDGVSTVGLNYTLKWLGLPPEPEPHNALTGAQMNVDVLMALTKMIQIVDKRFEGQSDGADAAEQLQQLTLVGPIVDAHSQHHVAQYGTPPGPSGDPDYAKWLEGQTG
jgi:DNA polymerase-3 subunit epsilon